MGGGVMPVWTHYLAHFVVVVIATISFGITFQMPRRHYLACGLTGAVGWMVYIFCVELFALSPAIATLVATLPLTGCARFFSIRHKAPVTIFLLPGIFPLVPGAGIYYTAYYFLQGEQELFARKGGETFKVALALALGIALVCSLPLPGGHEGKRKS
jgi:membrane spanning protein